LDKLPPVSFAELESLTYMDGLPADGDLDAQKCAGGFVDAVVAGYRSQLSAFYSGLPKPNVRRTGNMDVDVPNSYAMESNMQRLAASVIPDAGAGTENLRLQLKAHHDRTYGKYAAGLEELNRRRGRIAEAEMARLHAEYAAADYARKEYAAACRKSISGIYESIHRVLDAFRDIEHLRTAYEVQDGDLYISVAGMDVDEIVHLAKSSLLAINIAKARTPLARAGALLYLPSVFTMKRYHLHFSYFWMCALTAAAVFFRSYFFGAVGAAFFLNLAVNIFKVYENKSKLRTAYLFYRNRDNLLLQIDLLIQKEPEMKLLTHRLMDCEWELEENAGEHIAGATKEIDAEIAAYMETDPSPALRGIEERAMSAGTLDAMAARMMAARQETASKIAKDMETFRAAHKDIMAFIHKSLDGFLPLGAEIMMGRVLTTRFSVAQKTYKDGRPYAYITHDLPFENILFEYGDEAARIGLLSLLKLFLANALCNVRERMLHTTIYDTDNLGKDLAEFIDQGVDSVQTLVTKDFGALSDRMAQIAVDNLYKTGTKTVSEYNREAQEARRLTIPYHLLIVMSSDVDLVSKKDFLAFADYSTSRGVWVWVFTPAPPPPESGADQKRPRLADHFPIVFRETGWYSLRGRRVPLDAGGQKLIPGGAGLGRRVTDTLVRTLRESRIDIINYETDYRLAHVPDDKIWSYTTLDGIELRYGFLDGDPNRPYPEVLGDDAVHCLMAGQTGAGKSAAINQTLASLLHMYPPEWLELVMVDFKNVEFNMYTGPCLIPHASIIAGTKDGEYAISIFEFLMAEMTRRTRIFAKYKMQKIKDFNEAVLAGKLPGEKIMPRILLLCDEFQVMFTEIDDRSVDKIKKYITSLSKLARFCGCHMWFTSQSMAGTMSQDILDQFKLRCCLACSRDTSVDVLGNDAASHFVGKGNLVTNSGGGAVKYNRFYKVPFASNPYIKEYLPRLIAKGRSEGRIHRGADFYDESKLHPIDDLHKVYARYREIRENGRVFLLGERTVFSASVVPEHISLLDSDGENVMVSAYEREDACNLLKTLLENLKYKPGALVAATCGDSDVAILTDIRQYLMPELQNMTRPADAPAIIQDLFQSVIEREQDAGIPRTQAYYYIVGYDKISGLGQEPENFGMQGVLKEVMKRGPAVGIHVILYAREARQMRMLKSLCNYAICALTTEINSDILIDSGKASRLPEKIAIMRYGVNDVKFKIYQCPADDSLLPKREVFIGRA
jgi:hypothetical protein